MSTPPQDERPSPARLPGQPPVIYCSQCGKQNPYGANFCAWCHAPIAYRDAPPVAPPVPQSPYPPTPPQYQQYQPGYPPMPYAAKPPRSPIITIIGALLLVFLVMCVALSAIGYFSSNKGVASLGTNRNTSAQQATSQPAAARSTVRLSGSGIKNTESFHLEGDYAVSWTATDKDTSHVGCYHGADLESADKSVFVFESLGNDMIDGGKSKTGTSNLYNLAPATYYVAVSSGCSWTITFTPH